MDVMFVCESATDGPEPVRARKHNSNNKKWK